MNATTIGPKGRKFFLGAIHSTPGAIDALETAGIGAATLLSRHQRGDYGTVDRDDAAANEGAIRHGARILSAYVVGGARVWIITEADRSSTTLLLPEEY